MTAPHELGEWLAAALALVGLTEQRLERWFPCHCAARRRWLNERGEALWAWLAPANYRAAKSQFAWSLLAALQAGVRPESEICATVARFRSRDTFRRWAAEVPEVACIEAWPERIYGLAAKNRLS